MPADILLQSHVLIECDVPINIRHGALPSKLLGVLSEVQVKHL